MPAEPLHHNDVNLIKETITYTETNLGRAHLVFDFKVHMRYLYFETIRYPMAWQEYLIILSKV